MQWVAAQAKVEARRAQEKKAHVWAAISERKREQESRQTNEAEPKATRRRQDDGTEMPVADVEDAIAEQKRKRDVEKAQHSKQRKAKQRRDGTDGARERQTDLQAKGKDGAKPSDKATVPAKERKAAQNRKLCEHICPHCRESVTSMVDHRRRFGPDFA